MTYAIVETGGKQLCVEPGYFYDIELLPVEAGQPYTLDRVLLVNHDGETTVGQPYVAEASVEGHVMQHFRGRKVVVYKMKPKKNYHRKHGHRQETTRFWVGAIRHNGSVLASAASEDQSDQAAPTASSAEAAAAEAASS
ncbi:MAG: 50S ribosomal protein L21 [Cyanobacteria bacterium QS_8_64_29]|nr:MAG: 50S ribosomal protein L21 [Cyanobacteria bacterium QS_8_64_29]